MADGGGGGGGRGFNHPPNGGEFLLSLLQKQQHQRQTQQPYLQPQSVPLDPAVAAVGPTIPINGQYLHQQQQQQFLPGWSHSSPPPPNFFPHNMFQANRNIGLFNTNDAYVHNSSDNKLMFGSFPAPISKLDASFNGNLGSASHSSISNSSSSSSSGGGGGLGIWDQDFVGLARNHELDRSKVDNFISGRGKHVQNQGGFPRGLTGPQNSPPGFPSKLRGGKGESWDSGDFRRLGVERNVHNVTETRNMEGGLNNGIETVRRGHQQHEGTSRARGSFGLTGQLDHPGPPAASKLKSASASDIEQSMLSFHQWSDVHEIDCGTVKVEKVPKDSGYSQSDHELAELSVQLIGSLGLSNGVDESEVNKNHHKSRAKDVRSDTRGQQMLNQRMRFKRLMACRNDINRIHYLNNLNAHFLEIYMSLIPADEEKARQKKLLALLEKLVSKEWPQAQLYIYGSCANSFGVSRSDIDICLAIDDAGISKSDILLKLADILASDNLQKVQALTRARVPIVKLMDPETGLFADICINNVLAVVNTKLLRDYAKIDVRLQQLAFIVKHWAKSRGVNETYHGTLSSYAYVLMCIHFLQQRKPPILPCLQGMTASYSVTIDSVKCDFFDRVEELGEFGAHNNESISQLVLGFFCYWAYSHDYANCVISVRTGRILRKQEKDWTRRIGNDRHLICIEDPFEISHDLGRVVDKNSIRVLREEFERAASIMQHDPNPHIKLFEPYVPTL